MVRRLGARLVNDDLLGWSAQLAYYFFVALFPALICFVAGGGLSPVVPLTATVLGALGRVAPPEVLSLVRRQLAIIAASRNTGLLTFGIIGTVWTASAGMSAVINTLNFAFH